MRSRTTRLALAAAAGAVAVSTALVGLSSPALAQPTTGPSPSASPTTQAPLVTLPGSEQSTTAAPAGGGGPSGIPVVPLGGSSDTPTPGASASTPAPVAATASDSASPTASPSPGAGIALNLPVWVDNKKVSELPDAIIKPISQLITAFGVQIPSVDTADIPPAPFVPHSVCKAGGGTLWTITNTADHALGLAWFGSDIKGGVAQIGAGQTVTIGTTGFLALALPFNLDGKYTPMLPAIGLSTCAGPIPATIPAAASATPAAATPADAVLATPHFTG
jgi:hypothetical protein